MSAPESRITLPDLCYPHFHQLVHEAGFHKTDPWQALVAVTQIALFQAVTADDATYPLINGLVENIPTLGCLACFKPDAFEALVHVAKSHDLGAVKRLGESWVKKAPDA